METITINSSVANNLKLRYHKFMKICCLFDSRMELEADNSFYEIGPDTQLKDRFSFSPPFSLRISGEDESQAAALIKKCLGC